MQSLVAIDSAVSILPYVLFLVCPAFRDFRHRRDKNPFQTG